MALSRTRSKRRRDWLIIGAVAASVLFLVLNFETPAGRFQKLVSDPNREHIVLKIRNLQIKAELARTTEEHGRGLSGREFLPEFNGMLFVFSNDTRPEFWVKETAFPLDIIWIDRNLKITGIERNVLPETLPQIFQPDQPIRYMLEINAGLTSDWDIHTGETIRF